MHGPGSGSSVSVNVESALCGVGPAHPQATTETKPQGLYSLTWEKHGARVPLLVSSDSLYLSASLSGRTKIPRLSTSLIGEELNDE